MPDDLLMLKGSLVVLRDWTSEDVAPSREWLRPGQEWQAWDGPYFPRASDQETDQNCQALAEQIAEDDWPTPRTILVIADAETNVFIGRVAWYYESEPSDWCRIGSVPRSPGRTGSALRQRCVRGAAPGMDGASGTAWVAWPECRCWRSGATR